MVWGVLLWAQPPLQLHTPRLVTVKCDVQLVFFRFYCLIFKWKVKCSSCAQDGETLQPVLVQNNHNRRVDTVSLSQTVNSQHHTAKNRPLRRKEFVWYTSKTTSTLIRLYKPCRKYYKIVHSRRPWQSPQMVQKKV